MSARLLEVASFPMSARLKENWAWPFCGVDGSSGTNSTMCGFSSLRRMQPLLMTCMMQDRTSLVLQLKRPEPGERDASCF